MSTKHMYYWNHVLWSDEMKINLFGSDGFKHVWRRPGKEDVMPTVKHGGGNVMVWCCMSWWETSSETWTPTFTVKYCSIVWSPPSRNWVAGQCSSVTMTQTHLQDDHCFTEKVEGKGDGLAKHVLNPIEHLWGILKRKMEGRNVSNIRQFHDVVMEEWKSIPVATCETLVNSMPRRVKAVLDNDGGHTKYWQLTWCMLILTTFPKGCTHFYWPGFSF